MEFFRNNYRLLRIVYGLVPIVAGLDKFTNLLTDWSQYLSPMTAGFLPFEVEVFMRLVGIIEIAAGAMVLSPWVRMGAYIVGAWLLLIALNLAILGAYDIAVRDIVMAVGAYTLAQFAEVFNREGARNERPAAPLEASFHPGK